jgi:hypothetical protein
VTSTCTPLISYLPACFSCSSFILFASAYRREFAVLTCVTEIKKFEIYIGRIVLWALNVKNGDKGLAFIKKFTFN